MAAEQKIAIKIAGELDKSFTASIQGAQQGIASLSGGKIGFAFSALGSMAAAAGRAIVGTYTAIGASAAAAGAYAVNTGMDFESAMASAAATAGLQKGTEGYAAFEEAAREAGRTTSKTASEAANALEYMALAGWSVNTSTQALTPILQLSEATGLDLARTSDMVTDSMSALGLQVGENGEGLNAYLDVLASAQNSSNQTAEQLMDAYIGVGGVMNGLGVSFQDTAVALGVLANRGIRGSEAGTALNAIMANLTTGTGQAGKMMESLGISAFDENGQFIGLTETMQMLSDATAGMTDEQRNATLAAIGGKHHVDALNDLLQGLNATTEEGTNEWQTLTDEIYNSEGAMQEMRDTKLDTLAGDVDILTSSLQDLGITAYEMDLAGPLREAAQWATSAANALNAAYQTGGLSGFTAELGRVLGAAGSIAMQNSEAFFAAGTSALNSFTAGIEENAPNIGGGIGETIAEAIQHAMDTLPGLAGAGLSVLSQIIAGINANRSELISSAEGMISSIGEGLLTYGPDLVDGGMGLVTWIMNGIGGGLSSPDFTTSAQQLVLSIGSAIADNAAEMESAAINLLGGLATAFVNIAPTVGQVALLIILQLAQGFAEHASEIATGAANLIGNLAQGLMDHAGDLLTIGGAIIMNIVYGLFAMGASLGDALFDLFQDAGTAILEVDWLAIGHDIVVGIWDGVRGLWDSFIGWLTNTSNGGVTSSGDVLTNGWYETTNARTGEIGYAQEGDASGLLYSREQAIKAGGLTPGTEETIAIAEGTAPETAQFKKTERAKTPEEANSDWMDWLQKATEKQNALAEEAGANIGASLYGSLTTGAEAAEDSTTAVYDGIVSKADQTGSDVTARTEQVVSDINRAVSNASAPAVQAGPAPDSLASTEGLNAQPAPIDTSGVTGALDTIVTEMGTAGTEGGNQLMTNIATAISTLPAGLQSTGEIAMSNFNDALSSGAATAQSIVSGMVASIAAIVSGLGSGMYNAGQMAMQGLTNGLAAGGAAAIAKAQEIAAQVKNAISGAQGFQNGSPSKYFTESGGFAMQGLANGLAAKGASAVSAAGDVAGGIKAEMTDLSPTARLSPLSAEASGGGPVTVTYAPVFNISGASQNDVVQAQRISQREFERMMREYQRGVGRVAFG